MTSEVITTIAAVVAAFASLIALFWKLPEAVRKSEERLGNKIDGVEQRLGNKFDGLNRSVGYLEGCLGQKSPDLK